MWETLANGTVVWENASQIFQNITHSSSPMGAVVQTMNNALPWFWPAMPFALYLYMFVVYSDSPSGGKFMMITAIVLVISAFLAMGSYISDAVINLLIFILAFILSTQFKRL